MDRTPSRSERTVAKSLRALLEGLDRGENAFSPNEDRPPQKPAPHPYHDLSGALERFVQEMMDEAMKPVLLDGASLYRVRKLAPLTAELVGACWYIQQRLAPLQMRLQVSQDADRVDWCWCCLGELGPQGEITRPASEDALTVAIKTAHRLDRIRWKHCVEYGEQPGDIEMP